MYTPKVQRMLRVSLRTVLLLVTAIAVLLGTTVQHAKRQGAVVAWVTEIGGSVKYDYELDGNGERFNRATAGMRQWLCETIGRDYFGTVVEVYLCGKEVTSIEPLAQLVHLEGLCLVETGVSDLSALAGFSELKWLDVQYSELISDLSPLAELRDLKSLTLSDNPVRDISPLTQLTELESLALQGTNVTDVSPVARMTRVEYLYLSGAPVRDVSCLSELSLLKEVWLNDTKVTADQAAWLQAALPNCNVHR